MKFVHVTIRTEKYTEELGFLQKVAGLRIVRDLRKIGQDIVFLSNAEGETDIEVINTPGSGSAGNKNLSIGFRSDAVEAKRKALIEMGMDVTPLISPVPNVQFFFVTDPAGVQVQFLQDGSKNGPGEEA